MSLSLSSLPAMLHQSAPSYCRTHSVAVANDTSTTDLAVVSSPLPRVGRPGSGSLSGSWSPLARGGCAPVCAARAP